MKRTVRRTSHPSALTGSAESKRAAAAVLEVLSGTKTTAEASRALGVTLARYYQLEVRALQGLLSALEPKRRGRGSDPEHENDRLRRETERMQRDVTRLQALLRASQRAIGLPAPAAPEKGKLGGKRKRRPAARALRVVEALSTGPEETTSPAERTEPAPEARGPAAGA